MRVPSEHDLVESFRAAVARQPDKVAVVDENSGSVTFGEMDLKVRRLAFGLLEMGLKKGDLAIVQLPNWHEFLVFHLALTLAGVTTIPVAPAYRQREVSYIASATGACLWVIPEQLRGFNFVEMARELLPGLPSLKQVIVVGENAPDDLTLYSELMSKESERGNKSEDLDSSRLTQDEVAAILFTSGTTGDPKGVVHRCDYFEKNNSNVATRYGLTSDDVLYMPTPITHGSGFVNGVRLALFLGAKLVLQERWDAEQALQLCEAERCSFTIVPPTTLRDFVYHESLGKHHRLPALRIMLIAGSHEGLLKDAHETLPHCFTASCYGSVDFGLITTCPLEAPLEKRTTTDGSPLNGVELKAVDERGAEVPHGEEGQLLTRGLQYIGYYKRPDLDAETFDSEGFARTGDLGRIDAEGYVKITGRLKDMIRRGGLSVSPQEIERVLLEHPKVENVAIIGVPDPRLDERICACVVPKAGATVTLHDIQEWMEKAGVAKPKWPERVELFDSFPLSTFGRTQTYLLSERVRERSESDVGE